MCLDVLRAFSKSPATCEVVLRELSMARGLDRHFDIALERFAAALSSDALADAYARNFAQGFVVLMQAALLLGAAEASAGARAAAEAFCATRLNRDSGWGAVFGAGNAPVDAGALLDRAFPG
jgi:putative acyl-CoA dehydrogenase